MKRFTQSILWGFRDTMSDVTLKVVRTIGLFLVVATLTVGSNLAYPDHKTNHKPGKGGELTTNLMSVLFSNRPGDAITDDGIGAYIDERAGGDQGVEAFLFGSGNLDLRTEGSNPLRQLHLAYGTVAVYVTVRDLYNVGLQLSDTERDCDSAGHKAGNLDLNDRGLLCMTPGQSRASGFVIWWDDTVDPNRRFKLAFRYDYDDLTDNILITRCSADSNVNAARCNELSMADDLTWIFSTTVNYGLHTGPTARVTSNTIKGKRNPVDYGLFYMPFELIATCVQNCP